MGRHRVSYSAWANDARRVAVDGRNRVIERTPELVLADDYSRLVGGRIRRLRQGQGLTQAELVDLIENPRGGRYSTGLLSRMERGWANPPLYAYIHVAEALGVDPTELLGPAEGEGLPSAAQRTLLEALERAEVSPEEALGRLLGLGGRLRREDLGTR